MIDNSDASFEPENGSKLNLSYKDEIKKKKKHRKKNTSIDMKTIDQKMAEMRLPSE